MEGHRATLNAGPTRGAEAPDLVIGSADYPALYQVADTSSIVGQRTYRRLVRLELAFVIAGAVFGASGPFVESTIPSAVAALALVSAMAAKFVNRESHADVRWFDGRAVAETVKTQTWRYMMRAAPFQTDSNADRDFVAELLATIHARPNLYHGLDVLPQDPRQISLTMRAVRKLPLSQRRRIYIEQRLGDQAEWYKGRSLANLRRAGRWFWLSLAGQGVAAGLSVATVVQPTFPLESFVGVFAAVAASATAWTQLGRHDELAKAYALAYEELLTIRTLADHAKTEAALQLAVADGEGAISREHTMWMAKRSDPTSGPAANRER